MIFLYKNRQAKAPVVMKFGGTSLMTPAHLAFAAELVVEERLKGSPVVVVVSAMAGATDRLVELTAGMKAPEMLGRPEVDAVLATGEQVTAGLFALALTARGMRARSYTGAQAGIITDDRFGNASITKIDCRPVQKCLARDAIAVVTGFQGITDDGRVTTLGRGGSDTTAVALAAALGAVSCEVYTDVDGVYTEDPMQHAAARRLDQISYDDMLAKAKAGAKVLHPASVAVAKQFLVPLRVRSTFSTATGTAVGAVVSQQQGAV